MPELWTLCDNESRVVLIQLHWEEHGCYPDFYYELTNPQPIKPVINAPDFQELEEMETERMMSSPPRKVGRGGY